MTNPIFRSLRLFTGAAISISIALASLSPYNDRGGPVDVGGTSLQTVLSTNYNSASCPSCPDFRTWGITDVEAAQQGVGMWEVSSWNVGEPVPVTIVAELAGNAATNKVGIYSGDASDLRMVEIFSGAETAKDRAEITIAGNNLMVQVYDEKNGAYSLKSTRTVTNFLSGQSLGFYLTNTNPAAINNTTPDVIAKNWLFKTAVNINDYYFTSDVLNSTGPQALAFKNAANPESWAIAFEDLAFNAPSTDRDFDDFVFTVSGIRANPEPSSIALGVTALVLVALFSRRRLTN